MFSLPEMQSTATSLFSAYASLTASSMLIRSMAADLVPSPLRSYLSSAFHKLFTPLSQDITVVVDEFSGMTRNQIFDAADVYLRTKITPSTSRFKVSKIPRQNKPTIAVDKGEEILDEFENARLIWKLVCPESEKSHSDEKRFFELRFDKKFRNKVMDSYLPFVLLQSKAILAGDRAVKLYTRDCPVYDEDSGGGVWGSVNLEHPATFDTVAMDPELKKMIMEDLQRFLERKEFYKRVGKAWKRGYLLFGPPGTGKSSLIAAMANYLKFDIYDLELTSVYCDSELRRILISTTNRSILVIEDIDCSVEMQDRGSEDDSKPSTKLTLSGILNFIDGLWSSCGEERIIIFTTNHKERLDPALLRPGRMDVHIHMSYCTPPAFKVLASNYLGTHGHPLFPEIESLLDTAEATPAEVAEELMKSEDADTALGGVVELLKRKIVVGNQVEVEEEDDDGTKEEEVEVEPPRPKRLKGNEFVGSVRNYRGRGRVLRRSGRKRR